MESELVSGFMTEHAGVIFVFFFLGEYASILLMCILISIFFLGGAMWCRIPLLCLQLSNYRDILKFLVPSYCKNTVSGWINYLCKVTSHKIIEKEMDYRVSKSIILKSESLIVKEQWIDGSWQGVFKYSCLRNKLTGFERNYQLVILSEFTFFPRLYIGNNQINRQIKYNLIAYSSNIKSIKDPWFITGFTDAEGSFYISISKDNKLKTGWHVKISFLITF